MFIKDTQFCVTGFYNSGSSAQLFIYPALHVYMSVITYPPSWLGNSKQLTIVHTTHKHALKLCTTQTQNITFLFCTSAEKSDRLLNILTANLEADQTLLAMPSQSESENLLHCPNQGSLVPRPL